MISRLSMNKDHIQIVLLEGVHQNAASYFNANGYSNVERLASAPDHAALLDKIADAHIVGIRSRTQLTKEVLKAADKLLAIGCFCIGTNQVDLTTASVKGIPVFNAPYSNTRSVAELVLAELVMLLRGIPEKNWVCHDGGWMKSAAHAHEARGKTLGIIGYGHIGTQVSVLAEAFGMKVVYFDIVNKLMIGNAEPMDTLQDLMAVSDVVTLHVPATSQTINMIGGRELAAMKPGAHLINASRGNVIDIKALAAALESGHLGGAALDVFPKEPKGRADEFISALRGKRNVILTPHIGGSTQEAQANIGTEVAEKLVKFSDNGSTLGAVNFPALSLPVQNTAHTRFLHIHRNEPGVLQAINTVFAERHLNIVGQYLRAEGDLGYVVVEVDEAIKPGDGVNKALQAIKGTLRVRFLY